MANELNNCDCITFKELFERSETSQNLTEAERLCFEAHERQCKFCASGLVQDRELLELAASLPHFDVSEGLTQKILGSIEKQSTPGIETSVWPLGLVATLAFLVLVPFDSVQSVLGWASGILGLLALQFLMKTASSKEQLV